MFPCAPLPPPFSVKLSMPLFKEEGRGGVPYLCLAYEFPSHRGGLLPEQADIVESHAAKALFGLRRESAVDYASSTVRSGLNFTPLVQSDWRGASDYCQFL